MTEHLPPDNDPDDTDAGYRDTLEEKAYEANSTSDREPPSEEADDAPDRGSAD